MMAKAQATGFALAVMMRLGGWSSANRKIV
jgi:hypothetical protein